MLRDYKIYFVKYSNGTYQHFASVNIEHALYSAQLWIDMQYPKDNYVDVVDICLDESIHSLLIYKSE